MLRKAAIVKFNGVHGVISSPILLPINSHVAIQAVGGQNAHELLNHLGTVALDFPNSSSVRERLDFQTAATDRSLSFLECRFSFEEARCSHGRRRERGYVHDSGSEIFTLAWKSSSVSSSTFRDCFKTFQHVLVR